MSDTRNLVRVEHHGKGDNHYFAFAMGLLWVMKRNSEKLNLVKQALKLDDAFIQDVKKFDFQYIYNEEGVDKINDEYLLEKLDDRLRSLSNDLQIQELKDILQKAHQSTPPEYSPLLSNTIIMKFMEDFDYIYAPTLRSFHGIFDTYRLFESRVRVMHFDRITRLTCEVLSENPHGDLDAKNRFLIKILNIPNDINNSEVVDFIRCQTSDNTQVTKKDLMRLAKHFNVDLVISEGSENLALFAFAGEEKEDLIPVINYDEVWTVKIPGGEGVLNIDNLNHNEILTLKKLHAEGLEKKDLLELKLPDKFSSDHASALIYLVELGLDVASALEEISGLDRNKVYVLKRLFNFGMNGKVLRDLAVTSDEFSRNHIVLFILLRMEHGFMTKEALNEMDQLNEEQALTLNVLYGYGLTGKLLRELKAEPKFDELNRNALYQLVITQKMKIQDALKTIHGLSKDELQKLIPVSAEVEEEKVITLILSPASTSEKAPTPTATLTYARFYQPKSSDTINDDFKLADDQKFEHRNNS